MPATLLLSNPPRRRRRRRKMTAKQLLYFGPRRRRSKRRAAVAAPRRRRSKRRATVYVNPPRRGRRSGRRGGGRSLVPASLRGFIYVPNGAVGLTMGGVIGLVGPGMALSAVNKAKVGGFGFINTPGWGYVAAKGLVSLIGAGLLARFRMNNVALGVAVGGLGSAALDTYTLVKAKTGTGAHGWIMPSGQQGFIMQSALSNPGMGNMGTDSGAYQTPRLASVFN